MNQLERVLPTLLWAAIAALCLVPLMAGPATLLRSITIALTILAAGAATRMLPSLLQWRVPQRVLVERRRMQG